MQRLSSTLLLGEEHLAVVVLELGIVELDVAPGLKVSADGAVKSPLSKWMFLVQVEAAGKDGHN